MEGCKRDGKYDDLMNRRGFLIKAGRLGLAAGFLSMPGWFTGRALAQMAAPAGPRPSIYYPHTFFPALVKPGEPIPAAFTLPEGSSVKNVVLKRSAGSLREVGVEWKPAGGTEDQKEYHIIPKEALSPGSYSLEAGFTITTEKEAGPGKEESTTKTSVARERAVWVYDGFKDDFHFAVLADYHVGDDRAKRIAPKMDFTKLRKRILKELNSMEPEFVLIVGDIVYAPNTYSRDFATFYSELSEGINAPMFLAPGNHDLMKFVVGNLWTSDGREFWDKHFGPVNYSFSFGRHRFIGMNTWDWPEHSRDFGRMGDMKTLRTASNGAMRREQFEWIKGRLRDAADDGQIASVFGHHTPLGDMNSKDVLGNDPLVHPDDFLKMLIEKGARNYFYGHRHDNSYDERGDLALACTGTSGSDLGSEDGWGFRIVEVSGGEYTSNYVEVEPHPKKSRVPAGSGVE